MKIKRKHQELLKAIRKNPNVTLKELQAVIDANSIPIVDYHLKSMMAEGLIRKGNKWEIIEQQSRTPVGKG